MLTVILTILKILGIIIAVVVGLLLLIVLLVGFVPVRYKASVKYPEEGTLNEDVISRRKRDALMNKIKGSDERDESEEAEEEKKPIPIKANAVVSWLLHIVHVTVDVDSSGMVMNARLFGLFKLFSTDPEFLKKKEEKQKKKEEKRRKKEEKQKAKDKKKAEKKGDSEENKKESDTKEDSKPLLSSSEDTETDKNESIAEEKDTEKEPSGPYDTEDSKADDVLDIDDDEDEESAKYKGIKGKFRKIKDKILSLKDKFISIKDKIIHLNKKKEYLLDMKDNERVRNGVGYAKDKFLLMLKRILPKKLNGYVAFGMEDPASTGKILGTVSAFFPIWGEHVTLVPDFENKRLEVDADLKGRIMLALLVIPALKVWFNKDIKYIRKKVAKFKRM